jgi:hypothetical protein
MAKQLLYLFFLLLVSLPETRADHAMGMDISYKCLGPNQYRVTAELYRNCGGLTAPGSVTLNFSSITCGQVYTATLPKKGVVNISQLCGTTPTSFCNAAPGIEKHIYEGVISFPALCPDWTGYYELSARNLGITNLQSAGTGYIYVDFMINNSAGICNNSPVFSSSPVPLLCALKPYCYNMGTAETDGDSLRFELIGARGASGTPLVYNPGYTAVQPISTNPPSGLTFNPATGELCFTASMQQQDVVVVKVYEYRNGVLIGTQMRDMQFIFNACNNDPPEVSNPVLYYEVCAGDKLSFTVSASDPNSGQLVSLICNAPSAVPGSSFTAGAPGNPSTATFSWQTSPSDIGTYSFTLELRDNNCPVFGVNYYTYVLKVKESVLAGPDRYYCPGGAPVRLSLPANGGTYTWSPAAGLSCTTCPDPEASPTVTTTYIVTSSINNGCKNKDTVVVNLVPGFSLSTSPPVTICRNQSTLLSAVATPPAQGPFTWQWSPASSLSGATLSNPKASPIETTDYTVTVTSASGCEITGQVTVTVNGVAPVPFADTDKPVICRGSVAQLTTTIEQACGLSEYPCSGPAALYTLGTGTLSSNTNTPFYGSLLLPPHKEQYLYPALELLQAGASRGSITSIAFNVTALPAAATSYLINIRIGCTELEGFTTSQPDFIGNLSPVKTAFYFTPVMGWNTIVLDNPYFWDGSSSLVVEICSEGGSAYATSVQTTNTFPGYYNATRQLSLSTDGYGCLFQYGSRYAERPNMKFSICTSLPSGLVFSWTPASTLSGSSTPDPQARPLSSTTYTVTAYHPGSPQCTGTSSVTVRMDTTNEVIADPNITVCPGDTVQLRATVTGPPAREPVLCGTTGRVCPVTTDKVIGTGASTAMTTYWGFYKTHRIQMLYRASELITAGVTAGTISAVAFNVVRKSSAIPYSGLTVKMGCTQLKDFLTVTTYETGLLTTASPTSYTTAPGWNTHAFSTTFNWDGASNILVELCYSNPSSTVSDLIQCTVTPYLSVFYKPQNVDNGCDNMNPFRSSTRPNIRFTSCEAPAIPYVYSWSPADSVSDPSSASPSTVVRVTATYAVNVTGTRCSLNDSATVNADCIAVPSGLLFFEAALEGEVPVCYWQTATERDIDRFDVERSTDGLYFEKAGTVKAAGASGIPQGYRYPDPSAFAGATPPAMVYYRLREVSRNGEVSYSATRQLSLAASPGLLYVAPNPVKAGTPVTLRYVLQEEGQLRLAVADMQGRELSSTDSRCPAGPGTLRISTAGLSPGIYLLKVQSAKGSLSRKLVVERE